MKKYFLPLILALGLAGELQAGPIPLYENFGTVTNVPQIDAVAFANYGEFDVFSELAYDMQNTRYFTNRSVMSGIPGFRFDYVKDDGSRHPAANFVNYPGATIFAASQNLAFSFGAGAGFFFGGSLENPALITAATNIANHGLLSVGSTGLLRLSGQNLDLIRGGLEVVPASRLYQGFCSPGGSPFLTSTNFLPDPGVYDLYWFLTNQVFFVGNNLGLSILVDSFVSIDTPPHRVAQQLLFGLPPDFCYFTNVTAFSLFGAKAYVNFEEVTPTNWLYETVFVANGDPQVFNDVRFFPSTSITNPYNTVIVQLAASLTNVVAGENEPNFIYLIDTLASETNQVVLTNIVSESETACPTMMPGTFTLSRAVPCEFVSGTRANSAISSNIFYQPPITVSFTNGMGIVTNITTMTASPFATNLYGAYSASVSNILKKVPNVPGASVTNLPGRVEINADTLDMTRTRIRGEGSITVNTKHLIASGNAAVDSENLLFDLASTNGNLAVKDLAKPMVERFYGNVSAWSAIWTNQLLQIIDVLTNGVSSGAVTNIIEIGYHALLVDGQMNTLKQVLVRKLAARSTNVVFNDNMLLSDSLLIEGDRFTLNGRLSLLGGSAAESWTAGTAPRLRYFTNNGVLVIPNRGWFGNDRTLPYSVFVNRGVNNSFTEFVVADDFQNNGIISATAGLTLQARTGTFEEGQLQAGADMTLGGMDFKFRTHTAQALGVIALSVTNSLSDSGADAGNVWSCQNGFNLLLKPRISSLLGTTLKTTAIRFANPAHLWSADDLGASAAGYTNNAAIGRLVLSVAPDALLSFSGTGAANGLYVDFLELGTGVKEAFTNDDLGSVLEIADNLVLYFADANVPAESLDGQLDGHVRWTGRDWETGFAGPNSSVDVLRLNGQTVKMNRALRFSTTIDSDGDGVVNADDAYPLDGAAWNGLTLSVQGGGPAPLQLSWMAIPRIVYQVETTTDLVAPNWQPVTNYTNLSMSGSVVTLSPAIVHTGEVQRFYRVRYTPQ